MIDRLPNIYFAGNQRGYSSRLVTDSSGQTKIRCICVPDFASTHTIVLVDITSPTYETQAVTFSIGSIENILKAPPTNVHTMTDITHPTSSTKDNEFLRLGIRYQSI